MSRYKLKPCPGCLRLIEAPKGELCFRCTHKLADYDRMKKAYDERVGGEYISFGFNEQLPMPLASGFNSKSLALIRFVSALTRVFGCLAPTADGSTHRGLRTQHSRGGSPPTTKIFNAHPDLNREYYKFAIALNLVFNEVFYEGRNHGQDLLKQLNSGELSMKQFEGKKKEFN